MRNQAALAILALAVLAVPSLCAAQAPAAGAATKTYHSDAQNFDFIYPAGFAEPKAAADASPDAGCITVPIQLMDMRTSFNLISLKEFDEACLKKKGVPPTSLASAAASFLTDTLSGHGKPVTNPNANYLLAGRNASTVSSTVRISQTSGSQTIFGAASCVSSDKGLVCFLFLASDCAGLAAMSASTVKFLGAVASPVIPVGIGSACKK